MTLYHLDLPYKDANLIFAAFSNLSGAIFLDSNFLQQHYGRYSFIVYEPLKTYTPNHDSIKSCLKSWEQLFQNNCYAYSSEFPPFIGGLVGYFSYDLSKKLEVIPNQSLGDIPDYYLGLYNKVFAFDHILHKCYALFTQVAGFESDGELEVAAMQELYAQAAIATAKDVMLLSKINLRANFTHEEYIQLIEAAKQSILDGEIFEINLSQNFSGTIPDHYNAYALYNKLRNVNQAPFAAYLNLGTLKILSASPERFLSVVEREIEARPIKGTIKRSQDKYTDRQLAATLANSKKDYAENIMIVDLMRNDLSKICTASSVDVAKLCEVESFINLHHLVSVITGTLKPDLSIFELIPACFPGGSITGAPKVRAMQLIEELEQKRRGVYCGSIGYFSFNQCVDLSIAIRTIVIHNNEISFNVGGAITLASNALAEYEETLLKGQKLSEAINGSDY